MVPHAIQPREARRRSLVKSGHEGRRVTEQRDRCRGPCDARTTDPRGDERDAKRIAELATSSHHVHVRCSMVYVPVGALDSPGVRSECHSTAMASPHMTRS